MTTPRFILSPIHMGVNPICEENSLRRYGDRRARTTEVVGRWRVGRTPAMRWDGMGRMRPRRANLASAAREAPGLNKRSAVTLRLLRLPRAADRQGFPYVSIRLASVHDATAVRIAICLALVSDENALWYDHSTSSVR